MKFFEFGAENPETFLLLIGGGTCWKGARPVIDAIAQRYHVIVDAYDGFNPDEPEKEFVSVMDEARQIGDYVAERFGGKLDIVYSLSFGCRIMAELLTDERIAITTTIADGFGTSEYPNIKSEWGKRLYCELLSGGMYWLMAKAGPLRMRLIARLTGRTVEEAERLLYCGSTKQSWINQDYYLIGRPVDYEAFKRTDLYIWHGLNSSVEKKLAKNIQKMQDAGYAFTYKAFPDVGHGGLAA